MIFYYVLNGLLGALGNVSLFLLFLPGFFIIRYILDSDDRS